MKEKTNLHYVHDTAVYFEPKNMLTDVKTAVVGIDGYADSWNVPETQRQEDMATTERNVKNAIAQGAKRVVILTHVPPFVTDCWHNGEVTSLKDAPRRSSVQSATLFLNLANKHPDVRFVVYCGHTHNTCYQVYPNEAALDKNSQRKPNLSVYVGENYWSNPHAASARNSTCTYHLNYSSFLPDAFEFTRSGKTTVLKNGQLVA